MPQVRVPQDHKDLQATQVPQVVEPPELPVLKDPPAPQDLQVVQWEPQVLLVSLDQQAHAGP